jgi:SAM-dependent methyltransferase
MASVLLKYVPRGASVLDVGSGPCDKTAVAQLLGFNCAACDDLQDPWHLAGNNRAKIIDFAKRMGIRFRLMDGRFPFEDEQFDVVMLHGVIEHLHNSPRELLCALLDHLKLGGFLFITVPNAVNIRKRIDVLCGKTSHPRFYGYYWFPEPWRGHVREYTKGDLSLLAHFLNLRIVSLVGYHGMLSVLPTALRPIYRLATIPFDGWRESLSLLAQKPLDWVPVARNLSPEDLQALVNPLSLF